jgi:hypothetical protein
MKIIVILCMLLCALSAYANIWTDDFEREELGKDWTPVSLNLPDPPNWKIEDGILKGLWPLWNCQMIFLNKFSTQEGTIQVKCRIDEIRVDPGLADAGIFFYSEGADKPTPTYGFVIGSMRTQFTCLTGFNFEYIGTKPEKYDWGKWYILKLVFKDDTFLGYVNDNLICEMTDGRFKGNFVGLGMGANIDASFDDFVISDRVDDQALIDFDVSSVDKTAITWGDVKQK